VAVDDLPLPVVNFLNVIGVPWPYIDDDVLVEFASLTRRFAQAVQSTHEDATRAVDRVAAAPAHLRRDLRNACRSSRTPVRRGWLTSRRAGTRRPPGTPARSSRCHRSRYGANSGHRARPLVCDLLKRTGSGSPAISMRGSRGDASGPPA
jgi:hypothetical protein